jgi:TonB family protein
MPENILVVEYEPRYTDRVRQALAGQPFVPSFARDGEEALRALDSAPPCLVVLSSVVPKVATPELIRAIRGRDANTPILLTVSGYTGLSPKQDAQRMGASDILPKPYSESEFLGKVQQMLLIPASAGGQLTSSEIFGDLTDNHDNAARSGARKAMAKPTDDLDKLLADTLGGVRPTRKEPTAAGTTPVPPAAPPRPKTQSGSGVFDRKLQDTLSGLEKAGRPKTQSGSVPLPSVPTPPPAAPKSEPQQPPQNFATEKLSALRPEDRPVKVHSAEPMLAPAAAAAAEEEEPTDGIKFGQYVLLEKIATGGMAEVWKARMRGVEGFQKIVAIKKILPHLSDNQDFVEMFVDEAKLAAQLNHNNIIHIYDLGKIQSSYYIAMEYVDGFDLKTILRRAEDRGNPMHVELALFVASKIAAALDYAHRKHDFEGRELNLVHRDVSPQNVLISEEGDIKLCDFGIAKAASKASHTQAGALKGKLQYMSPEQAWGRNLDRRSDIFALSSVLFEMLTGRKLFGGDNELSILEQVREARVTPPSHFNDEVTPEIDRIVTKALQKDPANRYQTAGEMERDINAVLYSFRPTPTSADLAIFMHRLAGPEPAHTPSASFDEPEPHVPANELRPLAVPPPPKAAPVAPMPAVAAAAITPTAAAPAAVITPGKGLPLVPIIIGVVVVIGAIVIFMMRGSKNAAPAKPGPAPINVAAPLTGTTATTAGAARTSTAAAVAGTLATTSTAPAVDTGKVDAEVRKRLEAERVRLEQLRLQQNAPAAAPRPVTATQPALVAQNTPPPVAVPQPVAQPVAPPPVPVPQPVAQQPAPAPQPAAAERAQTGDLVSGEGLTPARVSRQAVAQYPPIARSQRMQGSVVVSALVNENGQVLDTRIVSSVSPIFNAAAADSIKRSTFTPGSKDGVKVKSWTTVRVDFKL